MTGFGLAVLAVAAAVGLGFALPRKDYVVQVVAGAMAVLVLASTASVVLAAWWKGRSDRRDAEGPLDLLMEAEVGHAWGRRVRNPGGWCGLRSSVDWISGPLQAEAERDPEGLRRERLTGWKRCRLSKLTRRTRVEDAFGLARVVLERSDPDRVEVRPWLGRLHEVPQVLSFREGDLMSHPLGAAMGDRIDLRPYHPGDPLRLAAWKIYARTGELLVRTPERAAEPEHRWAAFLVGGPDDEAAAALAWLAVERGLLGPSWSFGSDGHAVPVQDVESARTAILETEPGDGRDLRAFVDAASGQGPVRLLVFAPPREGAWIDGLEGCLDRIGSATVVVVHDGPRGSMPWARSALYASGEDPGFRGRVRPKVQVLDRLTERLEGAGVTVHQIDRTTGRRASREREMAA